jgi:hypothetical protein
LSPSFPNKKLASQILVKVLLACELTNAGKKYKVEQQRGMGMPKIGNHPNKDQTFSHGRVWEYFSSKPNKLTTD